MYNYRFIKKLDKLSSNKIWVPENKFQTNLSEIGVKFVIVINKIEYVWNTRIYTSNFPLGIQIKVSEYSGTEIKDIHTTG